jgi:hypothetical protein
MHTKSSANTLLLRKQLQAPLQMSSRAHKASKCNIQSLPFGQASSKRRRYTRGYTSQTNAASLKAGSRHGSGGHQAGWTALSVHLLQREQWQCDEAYLDAHECTLTSAQSPQLQSSQATQRSHSCSLSTETSPEPQFAFRAIWAPESCIQQLLAGWAKNLHQLGSFRHHHKDLLPQHCCRCKRDPLLQHCCQRKRLTQCSSELPPR